MSLQCWPRSPVPGTDSSVGNQLLQKFVTFVGVVPAGPSDEKLSLLQNTPDLNPQRRTEGKQNTGPGSQQVSVRPRLRCSEMSPPELLWETWLPKSKEHPSLKTAGQQHECLGSHVSSWYGRDGTGCKVELRKATN